MHSAWGSFAPASGHESSRLVDANIHNATNLLAILESLGRSIAVTMVIQADLDRQKRLVVGPRAFSPPRFV